MKLQKGFVSQKIEQKTIKVRTNDSVGFRGIVELNDTAALIWKYIEEGYTFGECAQKLTEKYDVSYSVALNSVKNLCDKMIDEGIAIED